VPSLPLFVVTCLAHHTEQPVPQPQQPPPAEATKPAGKPAPKVLKLCQRIDGERTLLDLAGKPQGATNLMGKVTVDNVHSIQCPVQAQWDERLAQIQEDFVGQDVVFLHIACTSTTHSASASKAT